MQLVMNDKVRAVLLAVLMLNLVSCASDSANKNNKSAVPLVAKFEWFDYTGNDPIFNQAIGDNQFFNPILTGFYPDPSIVRVGEDYYMTHSTFGFYPALPVFHSRDLVNWEQLGNAVDRPDMLDFTGKHLGWNGVYAPTIEYHQGVFYIINTCVGCGGNFIITAKHPGGPWSDPIWISEIGDVGGIDPQMFFEDGRLFIVNHEHPEGPELYNGHRAIWIREVNPKTYKLIGKKKMIVDGGINHLVDKPGYVEGPHLLKVGEYYYISAPEGGTGLGHRQTIYRSKDVFGPYEPWENNPILTQMGLDPDRANPITSTGHADMVQTQNGDWWAVFLGTRNYDRIHFATGRETFLLPVTWTDDGWPVILEKGKSVPYVLERPKLPKTAKPARPVAGNFSIKAEFDDELENYWTFVRNPKSTWWDLGDGQLRIQARDDRIGDEGQPSVIARRLHHMHGSVTTKFTFTPKSAGDEAGIIALQNDDFYYAFGLGINEQGKTVLRLRQRNGKSVYVGGRVINEKVLNYKGQPLYLKMDINAALVNFYYSEDGQHFTEFATNLDANMLGTMTAGGFTGAFLGMYAETGQVRNNDALISSNGLPKGVIAPRTVFTDAYGPGQTSRFVADDNIDESKALQLAVQGKLDNPWDAGVSAVNIPGEIKAGDNIILTFKARRKSGTGKVSPTIQVAAPPYDVALSDTVTLTDSWQEYTIKGVANINIAPGAGTLVMHSGFDRQTLEFAWYEIILN